MKIGEVKELRRHPVKSFSGESVEGLRVMNYGIYGDRSHAFLDIARNKYLTITQLPEMVRFQAAFRGEESMKNYPPVEVVFPDEEKAWWGEEKLNKKIEEMAGREIKPISFPPVHTPRGAIEEEHILIITEASIEALEKEWNTVIDPHRFRPNIIISTSNPEPFQEEMWIGKTLKIGDSVTLKIKRPCERCMIINVNPEDAKQDPSILKKLVQERKNMFGVYAAVLKTGVIDKGDFVTLS
ncbi:MOSC domain-containing protein [Thalassobacillus pellis]|uniref:MOSC domain-containing protein n=1 Tax=Thalassobacillus pellis TaxID=748008 RepID=UPI001960F4C8|nr:MOSC domain-containing protein [Thalassobacillus pellis]MBM7553730.1 uncharacterized protein YcbX [Thalassobacillus pellis]